MLFNRLAIIGPGLIGGSLGLAAKRAGLAAHVVGAGHRQVSIDKAISMGAIDSGTLSAAEAVTDADAVILCTSVGLISCMLEELARNFKPGCVVSDVGSTKAQLVRRAEEVLPAGVHFVGAHPIAGSEQRGIEIARADLFVNRLCVLTPNDRTDTGALERVEKLWTAVGARVRKLDPAEHDRILARTSHLPHAAAAALLNVLEEGDATFAGSGLRDTTRIGSGDPDLWVDIMLDNAEGMLAALESFDGQLERLREALKNEDAEALRDFLVRARDRRQSELL